MMRLMRLMVLALLIFVILGSVVCAFGEEGDCVVAKAFVMGLLDGEEIRIGNPNL